MSKLSVVISAYNEENKIETCLKSADFADEIVFIDNSSTDKTEEIAGKYTKNIYKQKNDPACIDLQKNFGFSKATGDWILSLDADEEVSPELAKEIREVLGNRQSSIPGLAKRSGAGVNRNSSVNGYWIPRKNIIFGKFIEYTGWYPDPQLRLFRKGKAKFVKAHVHEPVKLEGESDYLKNHLIHHHYDNIGEFLSKTVSFYAPNEAEDYLDKGYMFSYFDAVRFPLNEFLSRFFARKGYKDGFHGLMLSILMAFYHFLIFAFIWEKKEFKEYEGKEFLNDTQKEFKRAGKEIFFWITKEKIEAFKNPIKKNLYKISRKIRLN